MPTDALAIAPVLLAVVLVVSAVGKLRAPRASADAFRDLRVPAPLQTPVVVGALPWAELLLALLLVVAGGWLGVAVAVAALTLFGAYLALVVRALGFDVPVDCACFGEFAPGRITRRTVVRNAWLVVLAVLGLVLATGGDSVLLRVLDGRAPWWWLLAAGGAAVTTALVATGSGAVGTPQDGRDVAVEEGDYLRYRTPAVPVTLGDGSRSNLRTLSRERAQLLLYVSDTCAACEPVVDAAPDWRDELGALDVRLVLRAEPSASSLTSPSEPVSLHDVDGLLMESFGLNGTPSALLLGADGLLAGGPVLGKDNVAQFVDDIRAELLASG